MTAHWSQEGELEELLGHGYKVRIPEVLLVRKHYPTKGERKWQLKQLEIDERYNTASNSFATNANVTSNATRREEEANMAEYEEFMQEIEADREMRKHINLYKKPKNVIRLKGEKKNKTAVDGGAVVQPKKIAGNSSSGNHMEEDDNEDDEWEDTDDEDENMIKLDELLDDLVINDAENEKIKEETVIVSAEASQAAQNIYASVVPSEIQGNSFDPEQYVNATYKFV